jgi:hypothetical protein
VVRARAIPGLDGALLTEAFVGGCEMVMAVEASSRDDRRDPFENMRSVRTASHAYGIAKGFLVGARHRLAHVVATGSKNRDQKTWAMFFVLDSLVEAMKWRSYARTLRAAR